MFVVALFATSCSVQSAAHHDFVLVGSTACDDGIKSALSIPTATKCDFIRWNLSLDEAQGKSFKLDATYGEAEPNTLGFIGGGRKISVAGRFEVVTGNKRDTYRLKSAEPAIDVSLVKVNSNLFHIVDATGNMMIGNGGWSYTLNRNPALASAVVPISSVTNSPEQTQSVFVGRTPCKEIADLTGVQFGSACFKLKWKLTLNRDAATLQPSGFVIESTFAREKPVTGKWSIVKNNGEVVYRLEPEASMKPVSLLLVDDDHLLFLDGTGRPMVGNVDFSYTLDRGQ